jgi:hypothetical protein
MASRGAAHFSAAQGRRFGLTVGGAFLALATVAWFRGHPTTTNLLATLGAVVSIAGLIIPAYLGPVERAWMALAHLISKVTTPIVLGVMYLLVITPVGVLRRLFGGNPMVHRAHNASYWKQRPEGRRASNLTRQY